MTTDDPAQPTAPADSTTGQVSYAIFDQALWGRFADAEDVGDFVGAWLALLCRNLPGVRAAVTVLGDPDTGPFAPAARWPEEAAVDQELMAATERALGRREPVLSRSGASGNVAIPFIIDGSLYGAVAASIAADGMPPGEVVRQLRWAAGWIEVLLRREQGRAYERLQSRTATALEMLAIIVEKKRFQTAANALVTELGRLLDCDPVGLGIVRRGSARVVALSHTAAFGRRMRLMKNMRAAMDESIDQEAIVLFPPPEGWDFRVTMAHEELARTYGADSILTVPLQHNGRVFGALCLAKGHNGGFDEDSAELVDAIATITGPVLEEKRRNDRILLVKAIEAIFNQLRRLLGPSHFGRKLATLAFAGAAWYFSTATAMFMVSSPAELQGSIERTIVSPFNGYLADEFVQAGALVKEGQLLAKLDDQDLVLEKLRLVSSRAQRKAEYDQALANRERAEANIIESQIRQIESQIALVEEQIRRTELRAPFDGVVVSGDLSQSIGAAIERGQELFKIAPLDSWRVVIEVDETDLAEIEEGQTGQLRVASLPDVPLNYKISRITPISDQKEGRNFFRVDASLLDTDERLRPRMKGIAKTEIEERRLIWIWTRPVINWLKLTLWRWMP